MGSYRANTKSAACPIGYGQEETIKNIWIANPNRPYSSIRKHN
jgi:hypothetical protein